MLCMTYFLCSEAFQRKFYASVIIIDIILFNFGETKYYTV